MKVLIIRFSSIGDIVLTTPVIRCIKQQLPDAEVHFLTKYAYRHILEANPYVTKLHLLKDDIKALLAELKQEGFDHIIDLHKNLRTATIKRGLRKVPSTSYDKLNWEKWLLTGLKIDRMPPIHIVDRYMQTVSHLGVINDGKGLDHFIPQKEIVKESDIPMSHQAGFIGLVIGASYETKKLPVDKLKDLCAAIDHPIILLGGPEDRLEGEEVSMVDKHKVYNACGKFTLNESADLVRRSKLIISPDTGLMHIAAAFKRPLISIWGNTVPAFGMTPYYGDLKVQSRMFNVEGLRCRPCSKLGHHQCPKGHFDCMRLQRVDLIAAQVHEWLGKERK